MLGDGRGSWILKDFVVSDKTAVPSDKMVPLVAAQPPGALNVVDTAPADSTAPSWASKYGVLFAPLPEISLSQVNLVGCMVSNCSQPP